MAKKKAKKNQIPDTVQGKHEDAIQGKPGVMSALGGNAKTIGVTIASVLIGEIIEAAVERLIHKATPAKSDHNGDNANAEGDRSDNQRPSPIRAAASTLQDNLQNHLQDNLEDVQPNVQEALRAVKSAVSDMKPRMTDVVDALRGIPQQSVQRSVNSVESAGNTAKTAVQDAVKTAKSAVAELTPNKDNTPFKKGKKKGKKKNKKS